MNRQPRVACVVLNWNAYDDTADCLRSLRETSYENLDLIVVDNASADGSGDRLIESFPEVTVLQNDENLGFGAGMNVGIREALDRGAEYVVVTNNDILVEDAEIFSRLVTVAETTDDIGIVTPKIMRWPDTDSTWFEQGYVDERSGNASHRHSHRSVPNLRSTPSIDDPGPARDPSLLPNDYVPLCFAMVDATVFDEVGLLSERYFMYYEDIEFASQVRKQGYRIVTDPSTRVYHSVSGSSGGNQSPLAEYYMVRNRLAFVRSNPSFGLVAYLIYVWWVSVKLGYTLLTRRLDGFEAIALGAYDGVRGRTGRGRFP